MATPSRFYYLDGALKQYTDQQYAAVLADFASIQPASPKITTLKSDIWRRCVDNEAALLDGALDTSPAFLRRLFDAVTIIEHDAPEFTVLRDAIANTVTDNTTGATIGYTRADQLLAPSR